MILLIMYYKNVWKVLVNPKFHPDITKAIILWFFFQSDNNGGIFSNVSLKFYDFKILGFFFFFFLLI